jgi:hypothetical protein
VKTIAPRAPFPIVETIAALLVLAGFIALEYLQLQQQRASMPLFDTQSTYDAAPGGYRALYEVLQREGVRVQQFERHAAYLDHDIDVLVVSDAGFLTSGSPAIPLGAADLEAIGAWVKSGGTLVVVGGAYAGDPDLKSAPIEYDGKADDRALPVLHTALTDGVRAIYGTSGARIPFARAQRQAPVVADPFGAVVATYHLGKGVVVSVADQTIFQNRNLARADNARLAYDLVTAGNGPRAIVAFEELSHGHQIAETAWSILPGPARAALVILCLAILALLIGTFFRFGPVVRQPSDDERTSEEYLTSMAALLARGGATRKALRDVADAAIRGLAESLGLHDNVPVAVLAARLRSRSAGDESADALLELNRLRSYEYPKEADLLAAARIAAHIRKEYAPNARIGFGRRRTPAKRTA